ncbi:DUF2202 domain-containing protein [Spirochaeta thermophila]|uniref:DUF2202 domain-containing protein n=1 Tax=Winmispira thermophila (strain ATCC 49972 / DSM 6192 / RI 19.B1) TaxID=665571 RepID=E0RRA1_WINT6|nr:DUF2202 domain-containing protein [Spirochaeta thermophila]ADN03078.1 hypothetical protein STHERM_c21490 [Spirochaeta thermophila DSM 6192]
MKRRMMIVAGVLLSASALLMAAPGRPGMPYGVSPQNDEAVARPQRGYGRGPGAFSFLQQVPPSSLSTQEREDLLSLLEYEKAMRDLTDLYAQKFPQSLFAFQAERQGDGSLFDFFLDRYGIENTLEGKPAGSYSSSEVTRLYREAEKVDSVAEAVQAMNAFTERMLVQVREGREHSDNEDLDLAYLWLEQALARRLAAGVRQLSLVGITYKPRYLSQEDYEDLLLGRGWMGGHGPGMMGGPGRGGAGPRW